jgi:HKD family nuclease
MARKKSTSRFDLHEALNSKSYDHAVVCTFTFEAPFFEDYCLDRLSSLSNNGNISVILDRGVYEKAITGTESHRPKRANLHYLLHPISVPGVFHPKLFLLVSRNRGRLVIGSANFTRPGITSNAEMVGCYDYEAEKDELLRPLFQAAFQYLVDIGTRWPSDQLTSNLQAILRDAPWIAPESRPAVASEFALLNNLEFSLWDQISAEAPSQADTVYVVSRYFDHRPHVLDRIQKDLQPGKIKIYTQNGITNLTPEWLRHPSVVSGQTEIMLGHYTDDEQHAQPLHAKGIIIEKGGSRLFAFGSANFTSAALLKTAGSGNVETMLLLREPCNGRLDPERMFDPDRRAILLRREADLRSCRDEDQPFEPSSHTVTLFEASLIEDQLIIRADIPEAVSGLTAVLTSQLDFRSTLAVDHRQGQAYAAAVPPELLPRLFKSSTVVQLRGLMPDGSEADSNPLLVTNILDIRNDKPVRRERHIKEAQQSAAQFFSVLKGLLQGGDDQALLSFLNYCDIPVISEPLPRAFRGIKPVWDGGAGMRSLGERNLKVYARLHEATLGFFDRHYRRLQRHVRDLDPGGIGNFLHIFLATGGVLRAQMERLTQGLEARNTPLETGEWYDCRSHINTYMNRFRQIMDCLLKEYLTPMLKVYEASEVKVQFEPDLQPLHDLYIDMLGFRERIESLRRSRLTHHGERGERRQLNYFDCVLSDKDWPKYESEVKANLVNVERLML